MRAPVTAQTTWSPSRQQPERAGQIMDPRGPAAAGHQHASLLRLDRTGPAAARCRIAAACAQPALVGARAVDRRRRPRRRRSAGDSSRAARASRGVSQVSAVAVGDPGKAALQRPLGMRQLGHPPQRAELLGEPRDPLVDQLAAKPAGDQVHDPRARARRARRASAAAARRARRGAAPSARRSPAARASGRRSARSARGARSARRARHCCARCRSSPSCASSSARTGTAISAAAVGVGARRSAAIVDQRRVGLVADGGDQRDRRFGGGAHHLLLVERPQILDRAAAARDDQQVGPRLERRRSRGSPRRSCAAAPSPCTGTGHRITWVGQRSSSRWRMSRITAPVGEVTTPITRGRNGSLRLRAGVEQPFGGERLAPLARAAPAARPRPPAPSARRRSDIWSGPDRW